MGKLVVISIVTIVITSWSFFEISYNTSHENYVKDLLNNNPKKFGYTKGSFTVSDNGAAAYEIPLVVSPGTGGMAPKLSLVYNSQSGNGLLGDGWNINGLSIISRAPATIAQDGIVDAVDFDKYDRLMLDGQRLVLVESKSSSKYGQNNTEYRTEQTTFKRILCNGGKQPESFEVSTKEGLTYYYGYRPDVANSRVKAHAKKDRILYWLVDRIEDKNGNYILINYETYQEESEYRPKTIEYTGNERENLKPYNLVEFNYEDRIDFQTKYIAGSRSSISKILNNISMYHSDIKARSKENIVRNYLFEYQKDNVNHKTYLKSIQECAGKGSREECLEKTYIRYDLTSPLNFSNFSENIYSESLIEDFNINFIDVNNDGYADKLAYKNFGDKIILHSYINDGTGNLAKNSIITKKDLKVNPNAIANFGDYEGDGDLDLFFSAVENNKLITHTLLNSSDKDKINFDYKKISNDVSVKGNPEIFITDLNSDGIADMLLLKRESSTLKTFSIVSRQLPLTSQDFFQFENISISGVPDISSPRVTDVNADGLSDILYTWTNGSGWYTKVLLNKILNPQTDALLTESNDMSLTVQLSGSETESANSTIKQTILINTVTETVQKERTELDTSIVGIEIIKVDKINTTKISSSKYNGNSNILMNDINDDGILDLIISETNEKYWVIHTSIGTGNGSFLKPNRKILLSGDYTHWRTATGELNGDGLIDLMIYKSGSQGLKTHVCINTSKGFSISKTSTPSLPNKYNFSHLAKSEIKALFPSEWIQQFKYNNTFVIAYANAFEIPRNEYESLSNREILERAFIKNMKEFKGAIVPSRVYDPARKYSEQQYYSIFNQTFTSNDTFFTKNLEGRSNHKVISGFKNLISTKQKFKCDANSDPRCKVEDLHAILWEYPLDAVQSGSSGCEDRRNDSPFALSNFMHRDTGCYSIAKEQKYLTHGIFQLENFWNLYLPDLNGDGISDVLFSYPTHPKSSEQDENPLAGKHRDFIWINNAKKTGLLTKIIEGNRTEVDIQYLPLTKPEVHKHNTAFSVQYPQVRVNSPMYLVRSTKSSNGIGGKSTMLYQYFNGIANLNGRGFWGFQRTVQYHVDTKLAHYKKYFTNSNYLEKGIRMLKKSEKKYGGVNEKVLERVTNYPFILYPNSSKNYFLPYIKSAKEETFDFQSGHKIVERNSKFLYDQYGNQLESIISHSDGFTDKVINKYSNYENSWILGRLDSSFVIKSQNGLSDTSSVVFSYHNKTGQLIKEKVLSTDTFLQLEKNFIFDGFGNVIESRSRGFVDRQNIQERITKTIYDDKGRFVEKTEDGLGYSTKKSYNQLYGYVTSKTDLDKNTSYIEYDKFGNANKTIDALKNYSNTYLRKCSSCPKKYPYASHFKLVTNSIGLPSITYFDQLSRKIASEAFDIKGRKIIQYFTYDQLGQLIQSSIPHFSDKKTPYFIKFKYDDIGRIIRSDYPNGSSETIEYRGHETYYYDALDRLSIETKNSRGQVISQIEKNRDNKDYEVRYKYDLRGNTTEIQDIVDGKLSSNIVLQKYDKNNNKTHVLSPNLDQPTITEYNSFGEVIKEISPGGFVTEYFYDQLGRIIKRKDGTIAAVRWSYIGSNDKRNGKGQIDSIIKNNNTYIFNEYISYDKYSRKTTHSYQEYQKNNSEIYSYKYRYHPKNGQLSQITYPERGGEFKLNYEYKYGELTSVISDSNPLDTLYKINDKDALGQIISESYGNGVKTDYSFEKNSNNLLNIKSTSVSGSILDIDYEYDLLENILKKTDALNGPFETYSFDSRDRLESYTVTSGNQTETVNIDYDHYGNISSKSDVGRYEYHRNSILKSINGIQINHDTEGNRLNGIGSLPYQIEYTHFNKARTLENSTVKIENGYGPNFEKQWEEQTGNGESIEKLYIGGLTEIIFRNKANIQNDDDQSTLFRFHVTINGKGICYVDRKRKEEGFSNTIKYLHHDIHGSVIMSTDKQGIVDPNSIKNYDPWGKERDGKTWLSVEETPKVFASTTLQEKENFFSRFNYGYQQHEMIGSIGLINMGGRIFDPLIGQFLSIDPIISLVSNIGINSYAYVLNNPLKYVDPSGYIFKSIAKAFGGVLKSIGNAVGNVMREVKNFLDKNIVTIAIIAVGIASGGAALAAYYPTWAAGMAAMGTLGGSIIAAAGFGFGSAFSGAMFAGASFGDALQAGISSAIISGATAAVTFGVGRGFNNPEIGSMKGIAKAASHGVVQGTFQDMQGGKFEHGFLSGMFSDLTGSKIGEIGDPTSFSFQRVAAASMVGGTASSLGGGKFANGAISGAMVQAFNHETQRKTMKDPFRQQTEEPNNLSDGIEAASLGLDVNANVAEGIVIGANKFDPAYRGRLNFPKGVGVGAEILTGGMDAFAQANRGNIGRAAFYLLKITMNARVPFSGTAVEYLIFNPMVYYIENPQLYSPNLFINNGMKY